MLIHGADDTQIPLEDARRLKKAQEKAKLIILLDADHGQTLIKRRVWKVVDQFFSQHLLSDQL